jgi:hypothetical protein
MLKMAKCGGLFDPSPLESMGRGIVPTELRTAGRTEEYLFGTNERGAGRSVFRLKL